MATQQQSSVTDAIKKEIDLTEYAKVVCGLTPVRHGNRGYMSTEEHDSLVIDPTQNVFTWHSKGAQGSVIDFAMVYHGYTKKESISHLRGFLNDGYYNTQIKRNPEQGRGEKAPQKELRLPEKTNKGYARLFGYLVKTRGIDASIVQQAIDNKTLYQDVKGNACFCGKDYDGQIKYASLRTTATDVVFRGEASGSRKEIGFSHNLVGQDATKLFVTEAPIENMSIMTMLKMHNRNYEDYAYLSLGGTDIGALMYHVKKHPELQHIYLCQNNDEAGNKSRGACRAALQEHGYKGKIIDKSPVNKDFNDDLKSLQNHKQKEKIQTNERGIQHEHEI